MLSLVPLPSDLRVSAQAGRKSSLDARLDNSELTIGINMKQASQERSMRERILRSGHLCWLLGHASAVWGSVVQMQAGSPLHSTAGSG